MTQATKEGTIAKAAVMLNAVPCVVLRPDGSEEHTTVAKALNLDEAAQAEAHRAEWAEAAETIAKGLKEAERTQKLAMILDYAEKSGNRAAALVKSQRVRKQTERSRREIEVIKAQTAKMVRKTEKTNARLAEHQDQIATALQEQAEIDRQMVGMSAQIDQMMARLKAGTEAVTRSQDIAARNTAARKGREADEWIFKAGATSDPVLRAAFMARANGEDIDDDDI